MSEGDWVEDVCSFWFQEISPGDRFRKNEHVDEAIRKRFLKLHSKLSREVPAEARTDARTALATIIVLDQFSRNMFRGSAKAFASDPMASELARTAIDSGLDQQLAKTERMFIYMPLMHSEVLADQERCVSMFKSLENEEGLKHAVEHRDIIAHFGRFPHRNDVLARESTKEEIEFLKTANRYDQ